MSDVASRGNALYRRHRCIQDQATLTSRQLSSFSLSVPTTTHLHLAENCGPLRRSASQA